MSRALFLLTLVAVALPARLSGSPIFEPVCAEQVILEDILRPVPLVVPLAGVSSSECALNCRTIDWDLSWMRVLAVRGQDTFVHGGISYPNEQFREPVVQMPISRRMFSDQMRRLVEALVEQSHRRSQELSLWIFVTSDATLVPSETATSAELDGAFESLRASVDAPTEVVLVRTHANNNPILPTEVAAVLAARVQIPAVPWRILALPARSPYTAFLRSFP